MNSVYELERLGLILYSVVGEYMYAVSVGVEKGAGKFEVKDLGKKKGNWATQFKPESTKKDNFLLIDGKTTSVDMMNAEMKKVRYGESSEHACKVLHLPYMGEELAMIVVLPKDTDGLLKLEQSLDSPTLNTIINDVFSPTVVVSLPKFKLESSFALSNTLSALGMVDVFSEAKADLSGMGKELYVSQVFHKAFVDVNEEGTEAAAATAAVIRTRSLPARPREFKANHPFLFLIWNYKLNAPLFIGRGPDPSPPHPLRHMVTFLYVSMHKRGNFDRKMASENPKVSASANEFTLDIYKAVTESSKNDNLFIAPTSILVVMAMVQGNWATQFKPENTKKDNFHLIGGKTATIDMMNAEMENVRYGESSEHACKVLHLPYIGEELAMIVVLPKDTDGLLKLEQSLDSPTLNKIINDVITPTVVVSLPKFKLESSFALSNTLSALGMVDVFSEAKADLSGMGKKLYVSQVFHKAFVDVNEEGTEAAAATAAVMMTFSLPPPPSEFKADHPFLFLIWNYKLNAPLFIGRYMHPPSAPIQTHEEL
ncbi:ANT3-like protein [Mya arenaria]|uniref:ANT3-like protein n=1 Tax=Mya arenaria TaxID=6604 RepID=A0ABY7EDZ3_MYAAR|nr:ANT3-like protein [Mya arenaria]